MEMRMQFLQKMRLKRELEEARKEKRKFALMMKGEKNMQVAKIRAKSVFKIFQVENHNKFCHSL